MNKYNLPKLDYQYDTLEPYIDGQTMEIHYTKHHQGYVNNLNQVLSQYPDLQNKELIELIKSLDSLSMSKSDKKTLQNNGGGHLNHSFFWQILSPHNKKDSSLIKQIEQHYRSLGEFRDEFTKVALSHFGSGWAWLVKTDSNKLAIYSTPNQDSPYLNGHTPLLGLDLWEHAYYLKYQNRRPEYIQAFWQLLKLI